MQAMTYVQAMTNKVANGQESCIHVLQSQSHVKLRGQVPQFVQMIFSVSNACNLYTFT